MAEFFKVSEQTLNSWKHKHPRFLESLKRGKALADARVAESLFRRATGYSHPAVKIFQHNGKTIEHHFTEQYPPDTTAAIFWLKNRQPEAWREKSHFAHTEGAVVQKPLEELTIEEIDAELRRHGIVGKPVEEMTIEDINAELKRLGVDVDNQWNDE